MTWPQLIIRSDFLAQFHCRRKTLDYYLPPSPVSRNPHHRCPTSLPPAAIEVSSGGGREGGNAGKSSGKVNVLKRHRVQSSLARHRQRGEGGRQLPKKFRTKGKRFYQKWTREGIYTGFHKFRFSQNPCGCSLYGALEPKRSTRTQGLVKPTSRRRTTARFFVVKTLP